VRILLGFSGFSLNLKKETRKIGHKKHKRAQKASVQSGVCRNAVTLQFTPHRAEKVVRKHIFSVHVQ
jgi:hypothetical protein